MALVSTTPARGAEIEGHTVQGMHCTEILLGPVQEHICSHRDMQSHIHFAVDTTVIGYAQSSWADAVAPGNVLMTS